MKHIISCASCGSNGRFGNQLFQVSTTLGYATRHGFTPQIPADWVGRKIFNISIDPIVRDLPRTPLDYLPNCPMNQSWDCYGYFQFQQAVDLYSIEDIKKWFPIKQKWLDRFRAKSNYIATHMRRGDYVKQLETYCSITNESFERMENAAKLIYNVDEVVRLTEESPETDVECEELGIGFLPDFMKMVFSKVLIRSNSTMSWWASVFQRIYNPTGVTYAPIVKGKRGWSDVEFVEGNYPAMIDPQFFGPWCKHTDLYLKGN